MKSWNSSLHAESVMEQIFDILYPRRCPVCDEIVTPFGQKICRRCEDKPQYADGITCLKCGKPMKDAAAEYCVDCIRLKHVYDRGYALFRYRSISGSIYRFKYMGRQEYADYYADQMVKRMGKMLQNLHPDALIPVPMYAEKENQRGYNQAQVLALAIGKRLGIPVETNLICRIRNTVPMKKLDEVQRRNNLKRAFNIARNDVKLLTIIVIDDIYTTGSTADEIACEFRKHGVEKVYFLSLAIGQTT